MKPKIIRITTVPVSMNIILKGQLAYMNQFYEVVGVTGRDEKHFCEIAQREGIRMIPIELSRVISPFKDLKSLFQMYFMMLREKPDIVHTHTPKAGLIGLLAAKLAGVPVRLHTVGGIPWMEVFGFKRNMLKQIEKITYGLAHRVYPNSKGLIQFIHEQKICPSEKVKLLANGGSNGINTDYFVPQPELKQTLRLKQGINDNEIVLGFVGRMAREKGINEWLTAFEEVRKQFKVKILLIGLFEKTYGGLTSEVEEKIQNDPDILFLGRFDDVRPYYNMMDIFVFPSYREGFPNAVLEACAMGLPVIATDINGCNEIIQNGVNGILIKPKSSEAIYKALLNLLENKELRLKLGEQARTEVVKKFRRENIWRALKDEYDTFLINRRT
ncbi:MAG: glycosyltransferase family 4 protein [Saprospiraceae bacterium]|nr:glycosyltransferase family 4 protein [Saprospiraceae bacterium]